MHADDDGLSEIDSYFKKLNSRFEAADNDEDLLNEAGKVLKTVDKLSREEKLRRKLRALGVLVLIAGLVVLYWDCCYIYVVDSARLCILAIKPIIDLTVFYQERCLLKNPHYIEDTRVTHDMCEKTCVSNYAVILSKYDKRNFSQDAFVNLVVSSDLPLIELHEISNSWKLGADAITIKQIAKIYLSEIDSLREEDFCYFDSTQFDEQQGILKFFTFLNSEKFKSLSARWENCQSVSSKILRKLTKRPYFLPPDVEIVAQNWFFVSKGQEKEYTMIPVSLRFMMFCQLVGETKIKMKTNFVCESKCPELKFTLKEGEIRKQMDIKRKY